MSALLSPLATSQSSFVNFETPPIHPMDISPDGATLAVCNLPDARLMLFDLSSGTPEEIASIQVGFDPVTCRFRDNDEVWVVNHVSDSVSVVDLSLGAVVATLDTEDEPCDVVFAGSPERAFVSCSQANSIMVFNPADLGAAPTIVEIVAEEPKALAVSPDGMTVYAAIFESGNGTTLIAGGAEGGVIDVPPNDAMDDTNNPYGGVNPPPNDGGNFEPAQNPSNPAPPRVGLIVRQDDSGNWLDDNGNDWTPWITGPDAAKSGRFTGWELVDRDIAVIDADALSVTTYVERLMNINMAVGVNPATGDIAVVGTEALNEIRFEPVINGTFLRVNMAVVDGGNLSAAPIIQDLNDHLTYSSPQVSQAVREQSIGDPRAIVWNNAGTRGYVTGMGSNNVIVVNASGARVTSGATIEVGEGPTGAVLDEARGQLYVLNRFEGSISVVDTTSEIETTAVAYFDPTPEVIKTGRKHLYDTHKNSGLGHIACASCHVDARMDRLAWDLGAPDGDMKEVVGSSRFNFGAGIPGLTSNFEDFHPMKGPMTTQTLQDIIGKEPHHWRGDRFGIEEFNPAFQVLQGAESQLTDGEMQEFEDFLATLHFPPNPFRNLDNSLPTNLPLPGHFAPGIFTLAKGDPLPNGDATNGETLYRSEARNLDSGAFTCVECHTLPTGAGSNHVFNGSTFEEFPEGEMLGEKHLQVVSVDGSTNRVFKTPQIRNSYEKIGFSLAPGNESLHGFGLLHDGSIDGIAQFVSETTFDLASDQEVADMVAFVLSFSGSGFAVDPNEPPGVASQDAHAAVGEQVTITSNAKSVSEVNSLAAIADTGAIGLIAKSVMSGVERGWQYLGAGLWQPDEDAPTIATTTLQAMATMATPITFTAVPSGLSARLGIDRDEDALLDFDEVVNGSSSTTSDTDGDGLSDFDEVNVHGTDPAEVDTDGDGLTDGDEVNIYSTIPTNPDTDGDGIDDGTEVANGTDPLFPAGAPLGPWALIFIALGVVAVWSMRLYRRA